MKRIKIILGILLILFISYAISHRDKVDLSKNQSSQLNSTSASCTDKVINSNDYVSSDKFLGDLSPVDLKSNLSANRFRTWILNNYKEKANFAGHYKLIEWGCGTDCFSYVIINVKDGKVSYIEEIHEGYLLSQFDIDHNFLIYNPINKGMERKYFTFIEDTNGVGKLNLICSEISEKDVYGLPEEFN